MTLFSTKEDFLRTTLASLPGLLARLRYISELRDSGGHYVHWGLVRIYGDEATQRTLAEVHRSLFLQVLRTPLRQLMDDAAKSTPAGQSDMRAFLQTLAQNAPTLLPGNMGGGSLAHFNSVVAALLSLLG